MTSQASENTDGDSGSPKPDGAGENPGNVPQEKSTDKPAEGGDDLPPPTEGSPQG